MYGQQNINFTYVRSLASEIREAVVMIFWFLSVTVLICGQIFKEFISGNQCLSVFRYVVKFLQIKYQSYFVLLSNLWLLCFTGYYNCRVTFRCDQCCLLSNELIS